MQVGVTLSWFVVIRASVGQIRVLILLLLVVVVVAAVVVVGSGSDGCDGGVVCVASLIGPTPRA